MLVIVTGKGPPFALDRKHSESGGWGIWEFHRSCSSWCTGPDYIAHRFARIKPAEPKEGAEVELFLLPSAGAPEESWLPRGKATARYEGNI